jgi:uncharacterized protein YndB with AHSA1/START domain
MRPVSVDLPAPVDAVYAYLADPARRPEWQGSLRRVEDLVGDGSPGTTWTDVTAVGARPRMRITEVVPGRVWVEVGRWRGLGAELRLTFAPVRLDPPAADGGSTRGTRVTATVDVTARGVLRPVAAVLRALAPGAVRGDLRRAGRAVGSST